MPSITPKFPAWTLVPCRGWGCSLAEHLCPIGTGCCSTALPRLARRAACFPRAVWVGAGCRLVSPCPVFLLASPG